MIKEYFSPLSSYNSRNRSQDSNCLATNAPSAWILHTNCATKKPRHSAGENISEMTVLHRPQSNAKDESKGHFYATFTQPPTYPLTNYGDKKPRRRFMNSFKYWLNDLMWPAVNRFNPKNIEGYCSIYFRLCYLCVARHKIKNGNGPSPLTLFHAWFSYRCTYMGRCDEKF